MKKIYSILALLLLLVVTANAQTVNVVCSQPTATFFSEDNDLYVVMEDVNGDYKFSFDIVCATGATDIVDGQTYTFNGMLADYSYGRDYIEQQYIIYSSVSFVRNAGAYTVNVTDTTGVNYLITYVPPTPITQFVDSVSITMDNGRKNKVNDATASQGVFQLVGYDMTRTYNMYLAVYSNQIAGSYTQNDVYSDYTALYVSGNSIEINTVRNFTVTGDATACSTYVELVGADSILYKITYTYPGIVVPITPVDTVDVLLNNGEANAVVDYSSFMGLFLLEGYDLNREYELYLIVESDQIAGTYTQDDISSQYSSSFKVNGNEIEMYEVSNFTVVGDADTCSTYIEILGEDSVLYRVTFEYPGYVPPITPNDTVVVAMNDVEVYDWTSNYGVFQIMGQNTDYYMSLTVSSDQLAGTYTENDFYGNYTYLLSFIGGDTTQINALRYGNITVTGTAKSTVNAHVEMISTDTVLYIIDMTYIYVPIVPVDTIDIVFDDSEKNVLYDNTSDYELFQMIGDNGNYILYFTLNSNVIPGVYDENDVNTNYTAMYEISGTDTSYISLLEYRSIVVAGDTNFLNAHIEMISEDSVLYRINYIYPGAVEPMDTVEIALDNSKENDVYDETAINGSFTLMGADQNGEYELIMIVNSDQMAGTYTQASVAALALTHNSATDTVDILFSEIRDFTVVGDSNNCSTYIEMVGNNGTFYKMTFTYTRPTPPTGVENTEVVFVTYTEGNVIVVNGAEGETVAVYDMAGKMIANAQSASNVEKINVQVAGVYVVRVGEKAVKVVVK